MPSIAQTCADFIIRGMLNPRGGPGTIPWGYGGSTLRASGHHPSITHDIAELEKAQLKSLPGTAPAFGVVELGNEVDEGVSDGDLETSSRA